MKSACYVSFALAATAQLWGPLRAAAPEEQPIFAGVINKIFEGKCLSCHTAEKPKGKLVMTTLELISKGGESGKPGITPGNSAESWIYGVMALPLDHDDHKPPSNKPQPTEQELALVKWWIDAGAKADVAVKDAGVPADLMPVVLDLAVKKIEAPVAVARPVITPKELDQATKDSIATITGELGVTILQLSQSDTGLMFTAVNVADKFDDAALAKLAPLAGQLVDVNLGRTKVTDAGLATLAGAIQPATAPPRKYCRHRCRPRPPQGARKTRVPQFVQIPNFRRGSGEAPRFERLAPAVRLGDKGNEGRCGEAARGQSGAHHQPRMGQRNRATRHHPGRGAGRRDPGAARSGSRRRHRSGSQLLHRPHRSRSSSARATAATARKKRRVSSRPTRSNCLSKAARTVAPASCPGKPEESSVIKRLLLPKSEDEAMPPGRQTAADGKRNRPAQMVGHRRAPTARSRSRTPKFPMI